MQSQRSRTAPEGIRKRHSKKCPAHTDQSAPCRCTPSWEAWVWSERDGRKIRKTFKRQDTAKAWRADAKTRVGRGELGATTHVTLNEAAGAWLEGAKDGAIRARGGRLYKPAVLRGYEAALTNRILPALGGAKLAELTRRQLQAFADQLLAEKLDPSTVRNALMPLRAIYRRALRDNLITVNPTVGIELPAAEGVRDRIASVDEAAQLLAALAERDRPLWATALFAGLRRGELCALKWENVDLGAGRIQVHWGWDEKEGMIETKNRERRTVPITPRLRDFLDHLKAASGCADGFVFGSSATHPFTPTAVRSRALRAWAAENKRRAKRELEPLEPITLHECRHTFASMMIAAGVNAKSLSHYMGHSGIEITLNRYGHLMPGNEDEAAEMLDAYLARADTASRLAALQVEVGA